MKKYVIIVAGGKGLRMGNALPKQFINIAGKPIIMHTIERFKNSVRDINIILVLSEETEALWERLVKEHDFQIGVRITTGGATRFESVKNGLKLVEKNSVVAIHDAVRPFVSCGVIENSFISASEGVGVIPVVDLVDSIREVNGETSISADRSRFKLVQTPQVFLSEDIRAAYDQDYKDSFTDDASVFESAGGRIRCIEGNRENIKITTPFDLKIADILTDNA